MSRVIIFGSGGFVGRHITKELASCDNIELIRTGRRPSDTADEIVDLENIDGVTALIDKYQPNCIVNAAGILENSNRAQVNLVYTSNIISALRKLRLQSRLIVCGSAAEYGHVEKLPVNENDPCHPFSEYGRAKYSESRAVIAAAEGGLDAIVTRLFNPIGAGMSEKFLINSVLSQLRNGATELELTRKDAVRDYISIADVARVVGILATTTSHEHTVYNVGTGLGTTNGELIETLLHSMESRGMLRASDIRVTESSTIPEQQVASVASIERLRTEFGWKPETALKGIIEEIIDAEKTR